MIVALLAALVLAKNDPSPDGFLTGNQYVFPNVRPSPVSLTGTVITNSTHDRRVDSACDLAAVVSALPTANLTAAQPAAPRANYTNATISIAPLWRPARRLSAMHPPYRRPPEASPTAVTCLLSDTPLCAVITYSPILIVRGPIGHLNLRDIPLPPGPFGSHHSLFLPVTVPS